MKQLRAWGGSYSGNTAVSKTAYVGSIPTPPAKEKASPLGGAFSLVWVLKRNRRVQKKSELLHFFYDPGF